MALPRNDRLTANARQLRKDMTKEEHRLWQYYLRRCPVKFYRQRVVGNYILDFYCASIKLAVELDGSQHYEPTGRAQDMARTAYLNSLGITVLRFSNRDVMENFEGVCREIEERIRFAPKRRRKFE